MERPGFIGFLIRDGSGLPGGRIRRVRIGVGALIVVGSGRMLLGRRQDRLGQGSQFGTQSGVLGGEGDEAPGLGLDDLHFPARHDAILPVLVSPPPQHTLVV